MLPNGSAGPDVYARALPIPSAAASPAARDYMCVSRALASFDFTHRKVCVVSRISLIGGFTAWFLELRQVRNDLLRRAAAAVAASVASSLARLVNESGGILMIPMRLQSIACEVKHEGGVCG